MTQELQKYAGGVEDVWTQADLAAAAKIALPTVKRYETGVRTPMPNNLTAIRRALEDAGVEFIPAKNGKGVGVRLREEC